MKKLILFLVLFLYVVPAIGITVSAHYCSGELSGVSLGLKKEKTCGCKIGMVRKSCCKDVVLSMKITDDQQKVLPFSLKLSPSAVLVQKPLFVYRFAPAMTEEVTFVHTPEIPPGRYKQPLYLQNESFLI